MVAREHAIAFGWATEEQMDQMKSLSLKVHAALSDFLKRKG